MRLSNIINTIKYYLSVWWLESDIYLNIVHKSKLLYNLIQNSKSYDEAYRISNLKQFKYISRSYKLKLLDEKFNRIYK